MVEHVLAKDETRVRFSLPAQIVSLFRIIFKTFARKFCPKSNSHTLFKLWITLWILFIKDNVLQVFSDLLGYKRPFLGTIFKMSVD